MYRVTKELGEKVRLLPGPSAYRYGHWGWLPLFVGTPLLVPTTPVVYLATGSSTEWQSPLWWACLVLGVASIGVAGLFLLAGWLKSRREVARGYTTTVRAYQRFKQVDPRSGVIIRRAGDPFLEQRPDGFDGRRARGRVTSPR